MIETGKISDDLDLDEISLNSSIDFIESDSDEECHSTSFANHDKQILTSICNAYALKDSVEFSRLLEVFKSDHTQCDITNEKSLLSVLDSSLRLIHGYRRNSAKKGRKNYSLPILIGRQKRSILAKLKAVRCASIPKKRGRKPKVPNSDGYYSDHGHH